jgi:23S rRNA pseudouridine2605 synthase
MKTPSTLPAGYERLERVIAHQGLASRREAKDLIGKKLVQVNGKLITEPGFGVRVGRDVIQVLGQQVKESYLVYKPVGIETTKTTSKSKDLHDAFPALAHLSPVGRLDKETAGLIIMTNDGTLTKALTKENSSVGKTYLVHVRENISDAAIEKMSHGILLDKIKTKPAVVVRKSRSSFLITLHEGRKHQIRRMCDVCKLTIESLTRIQIGHLSSAGMKPGNVKKLTPVDLAHLKV